MATGSHVKAKPKTGPSVKDANSNRPRGGNRFKSERFVLCLSLVCIPFMSIISVGGTEVNLSIADAIFPVVAFFALRSKNFWRRPDSKLLYGYIFVTLTAIMLSFWWASITSDISFASGILSVAKLIIAFAYLLILAGLMTSSLARGDYLFVKVWAGTSAVIAGAALASSVLGINAISRRNAFRSSGSFDDPNLFAIYLVVSAGVGFWLYEKSNGIFPLLATLLNLAAISTTGSRGGAVALVAALLLAIIWMSWRNKLRLLLVALLGALWLMTGGKSVLASALASQSIERIISNQGGLDSAREELWAFGIDLWGENIVLGVGPGQFQVLSSGLLDTSRGNVVHNTYLSIGVELGLVGLICFFSLWLFLAIRVLRMRGGRSAGLLWAVGGLALGMITLNLENARFAWALAAFVWAITRPDLNGVEVGGNASTVSRN